MKSVPLSLYQLPLAMISTNGKYGNYCWREDFVLDLDVPVPILPRVNDLELDRKANHSR